MIFEQLNPIKFINADELDEMLMRNSKNTVLLDVREKRELNDELGHLEGIIHIPIGSLSNRLNELEQDLDKTIVVICRSGNRSKIGAQILIKAGFKNVLVLEGGMISWRNSKR